MKKQKTWGGPRKGSGRPKQEPTKTLSYRVPEKFADKIDAEVRKIIEKYKPDAQ